MPYAKIFAWGGLTAAYLFMMAVTALAQGSILNVSYDVSRELYKDINPACIADWKAKSVCLLEPRYDWLTVSVSPIDGGVYDQIVVKR